MHWIDKNQKDIIVTNTKKNNSIDNNKKKEEAEEEDFVVVEEEIETANLSSMNRVESIGYLPKLNGESSMIEEGDIISFISKLPPRYSTSDWNLLYSTLKHGISINTFYSRVVGKGPTVLLIEDSKHYVFGAFISDSWRNDTSSYYGTGESFLFSLKPIFKVYKWTSLNNYFVLSTGHSISIGGGGSFGIWINKDFTEGSSNTCTTFNNPTLSSDQIFKCNHIEVWGLDSNDTPVSSNQFVNKYNIH